MAKYNELLEIYDSEIKEIKQMEKRASALLKEIDEIESAASNADEAYWGAQDKYSEWNDLRNNINVLYDRLRQDIDIEYHDVPYAAPRKQGIARFWEEAFGK